MTDLSAILGKRASDVKRNEAPVGDFLYQVTGYGTTDMDPEKFKKSSTGKPQVCFECNILQALEVDHELMEGVTLPIKERYSFYPDESTVIYLKEFLVDTLKLPDESIQDLLPLAVGKMFRGNRVQRTVTSNGESKLRVQLGKTLPVD